MDVFYRCDILIIQGFLVLDVTFLPYTIYFTSESSVYILIIKQSTSTLLTKYLLYDILLWYNTQGYRSGHNEAVLKNSRPRH